MKTLSPCSTAPAGPPIPIVPATAPISTAPTSPSTRLVAGPAAATAIMPKRGLSSRRWSTGTGFGPAEDRPAHQPQPGGHDERADRIDMAHRVERQPPLLLRSRVAQRQRGPAMRDLVEDDRDHQARDHDRRDEEGFGHGALDGAAGEFG